MRAKTVNENINFTRGDGAKATLEVGEKRTAIVEYRDTEKTEAYKVHMIEKYIGPKNEYQTAYPEIWFCRIYKKINEDDNYSKFEIDDMVHIIIYKDRTYNFPLRPRESYLGLMDGEIIRDWENYNSNLAWEPNTKYY